MDGEVEQHHGSRRKDTGKGGAMLLIVIATCTGSIVKKNAKRSCVDRVGIGSAEGSRKEMS